eukprot:gene2703-2763_t
MIAMEESAQREIRKATGHGNSTTEFMAVSAAFAVMGDEDMCGGG